MPYDTIRTAGKLTRKQKKKIIRGVTRIVAREADNPVSSIIISMDEESLDNIAVSGRLLFEK